ncbi:MAG: Conserved rane protein of unknown function [Bradyrhizobium sp.]|nr:Conserved rane protein of unknown function [Bradyrhizobium sp.]
MSELPAGPTPRLWFTPAVLPQRLAVDLRLALAGAVLVASLIGGVQLFGFPIFFTSWASSAALLLTSPEAPSARPHRVGLSHLATALVGLCCHSIMPNSAWAIGLAVGLAIAICLLVDIVHPPAVANSAFAFVNTVHPVAFATIALLGALGLAAFAMASDHLASRARSGSH